MLTAFVRRAGGETEILDSMEKLPEVWNQEKVQLWIDVAEPNEAEAELLKSLVHADPGTWEDCHVGDPRSRVDEHEHFLFLLLYGVLGTGSDLEMAPRKLAIFCGAHFLITVHPQPLSSISTLTHRYRRQTSVILKEGIPALLHNLLDLITINYETVVDGLNDRLEDLEDVSLQRTFPKHFLAQLFPLRRQIIELRRLASAQRELLMPMANGESDFVSPKLSRRFRQVRDQLTKVLERTEGLREILQGIRDNYHAAMSARTNEQMKRLTLVATILLPLSLIAGIYGMNLDTWPSERHPFGFLAVIGIMAALAVVLLWFFRRRDWL